MTHFSRAKQALGLLGWLAVCFGTAGIGAIASARATSFYEQLSRPTWAPPAWLFGPVWSVLYFLIAIAAWLVWQKHGFRGASVAFKLFGVQLIANALWSWLFFAWHLGALSLAEVILLWVLITGTIIAFWRLHKLAALLLLPYLAWVSFATVLTYSLWRLNPDLLA